MLTIEKKFEQLEGLLDIAEDEAKLRAGDESEQMYLDDCEALKWAIGTLKDELHMGKEI